MSAREIRAGKAFVEVGARDKLSAELTRIQRRMAAFGKFTTSLGRKLLLPALAATAALAFPIRTYAAFTDQMAAVKAVSGATGQEFEKLKEQAKELGRTTSYTAAQVAGLQTELARGGFKPKQIEEATGAILNMARATGTELPRAAQIGSDILRGFRLETSEMTRVADVATATVNGSSQGLEDYFEAMKHIGPVAAEMGESIETTSAAVAVLANNGIKGSLAGTALRRAYMNLVDPSIVKDLQKLTGVTTTDAAGNLRPLVDILADIGTATKNLPSAKRLEIFSTIFGARGLVAASNLANQTANFENLRQVIEASAGTAQRTAKIMDDNLAGSFRMLSSAAEGTQIALGEALDHTLRSNSGRMIELANSVTAWIKENEYLVVSLFKVVTASVLIGGALVGIGTAANVVSSAIGGVVMMIKPLLLIGKVLAAALVSPWVLLAAAIGAVLYAVTPIKQAFQSVAASVMDALGPISEGLLRGNFGEAFAALWASAVVKVEEIWFAFKNEWLGDIQTFVNIFSGAWDLMVSAVSGAGPMLQAAWSATTQFFSSAWATATELISAAWKTTVEGLQGIWEVTVAAVNAGMDAIGEVFSGLVAELHSIWAETMTVLSSAWDAFAGIFTAIGEALGSVWATITGAIGGAFNYLTQGMTGGIKTLSDAWYELVKFVGNLWSGLEIAWVELTSLIMNAWTRIMDSITNIWTDTQNAVSKGWIKLMGLFDDSVDVEATIAILEEGHQAAKAEREKEKQTSLADIEQRRKARRDTIERDRSDTVAGAEIQKQDARQRTADAAAKDAATLEAAKAKRAAALQALDMANRDKAAAAEYAAAENAAANAPDKPLAGPNPEVSQAMADALNGALARAASARGGVKAASARVEAVGTFSALAAARGLGAGSSTDRTLKAAEATAENTDEMKREIKRQVMAFS